MNNLLNISPIDGRYHEKTKELSNFFSEYALIKYRVLIEIKWLIYLLDNGIIDENISNEEKDKIGDTIRELGHEYGTTTKRPRRCGWLDIVALNYAIRINGITGICMNHLDTVGKLDKIKICVAYEYKGKKTEFFRTNIDFLNNCKPVYEEFDGNFGDISKCKTFDELPENAKKFVNRIEELTDTPIKFIGTGAARENIIVR